MESYRGLLLEYKQKQKNLLKVNRDRWVENEDKITTK